jgi:DNA-binding NarL/FixJ family response regulator
MIWDHITMIQYPLRPTRSARILIVDDHEVVRAGLAQLLKVRWTICGEAVDGKDAVEKVRELRPDVVVLDISMPRRGGVATAREIRHFWPKTKIIFYSMHDCGPSPSTQVAKLAGADAFVTKRRPVRDLIQTIQSVIEDERTQSS